MLGERDHTVRSSHRSRDSVDRPIRIVLVKHGNVDELPPEPGSQSKHLFDIGEEMGQGDDYIWIDPGHAITEMCQEFSGRGPNDPVRPQNPPHVAIAHASIWDPMDS